MTPHSIEAEQNVLGALLVSPPAIPKVSDWLAPEDFHHPMHADVYRVILALTERDDPVDVVTVGEYAAANRIDVPATYIVQLGSDVTTVANVEAYAEIVADKARLRRLMDVGAALTEQASRGVKPAAEIALEASSTLLGMTQGTRSTGAKTAKEIARDWFAELEARHLQGGGMVGLATPWSALNGLTLGFCPGDLVVLGARPSMGKSAAAVNFAVTTALAGKRAMVFSMEMTRTAIFNRAVACTQMVPLQWLRSGGKTEGDFWTEAVTGMRAIRDSGLLVDDDAGLTYQQVIARARREHMRAPLDLVVIDHLHILNLPGKNATQEVNQATTAFKGLAKRLGCPVLLLSQLNRNLESRANKRPIMADLRESGGIEQDADVILFLYRDDYYADREGRPSEFPGWVEMIVAKQREGEAGKTIWLHDQLAFGLLGDYDGPDPKRVAVIEDQPKTGMRSRLKSVEAF